MKTDPNVPKEAIRYIDNLMGRSVGTKRNYESFVHSLWTFLGTKKPINEVTVDDMMGFLKDGLQKKKWKPATAMQYARLCRAFFSEFKDEAFLRQFKRQLRALPKSQNRVNLLEGVYIPPDKIEPFIKSANDEEWAILYTMILKWGLRLNEALNIAPSDINVDKNRVIVHGKGLGGMGKIRQVLVEKSTITRVLQYAGCSREQIMGESTIRDAEPILKTIKPRNAEYKWKETAKKVGLENWSKLTPHDGRHSYAIDFLIKRKKEGMPALVLLKNQLGHVSITTTQIYLDIAGGEAQDIFDSGLNNNDGVAL